MTERLDENSAMGDDGEVVPFDPSTHGDIEPNPDLIDESINEDRIEGLISEEARLQKAQEDYDQRLDEEADKAGSYDIARSRLEAKGIRDPRDDDRRQQELLAERSGVRSPDAELAIDSIIRASDESEIRRFIEDGMTLNEAIAKVKARKELKDRDY